MFGGNAALALAGVQVAQSDGLGVADAAYFGVLAALLGARWLDVRRFGGLTTDAEPASPAVLQRYLIVASALGLVGWGVARAWAAYG